MGTSCQHSYQRNEEKKSPLATYYNIGDNYGVIEFTPDGTITGANKLFCAAVEYSEDEIVGKHHSIFVSDEYRVSAEYKKFWANLGSGTTFTDEFKRVTKS